MKSTLVFLIIVFVSFSCKKEYNCKCEVTAENLGGGNSISNFNKFFKVRKSKKSEAEADCHEYEQSLDAQFAADPNFPSHTTNCDLILEKY